SGILLRQNVADGRAGHQWFSELGPPFENVVPPEGANGDPVGWTAATGLLWLGSNGRVVNQSGGPFGVAEFALVVEGEPAAEVLSITALRDDGLATRARIQGPTGAPGGSVVLDDGLGLVTWSTPDSPSYTTRGNRTYTSLIALGTG